jgi:hypothetical protein
MDTFADRLRLQTARAQQPGWSDGGGHGRDARVRIRSASAPRPWSARPNLIVNPNGDAVFASHVRRLAADTDDPGALERALRERYPRVVVRRRELSGEAFEMWYVYREGQWSPPEG